MKKKTVAVLFGGVSSEHDVSLVSATSVLNNIPVSDYDVVKIGITKDGRWLLYSGPNDRIPNGEWERDPSNISAVLSPDSSHKGFLTLSAGQYELLPVDCVFPVLHGKNGEDGTVQGLLALAGIPFVGCDLISSANCMDKQVTHTLLDSAGIRTAKWNVLLRSKKDYSEEQLKKIETSLGYPIFVKPANAGSSVGITKAHNRTELLKGIELAFFNDRKAILEQTIDGIEVECAVLGNNDPIASVLGQITPSNEFYDFEAKYVSGSSLLDIPAKIDAATAQLVRDTAIRAYRAIGCSGLARVDFFVCGNKDVILNEINTLPGFTDISMYPKLWEASGIAYGELISRLIRLAFEKEETCRG